MPCGFGPFEVLARIAASRVSQTFVALHGGADGFRRVIALRTLQPELCGNEQARIAFANGAKLAAKLNHPVCVGVETFGQERGIYYLTMEYVPGETWKTVLAAAGPSHDVVRPEIVAHMIGELCEGLHHAHDLRGSGGSYHIVHRGIASDNIVIDDHGRPRIIDFATGKSTLSQDATETGVIKGSFRYMAPEQILGKAPDRRCDIYSLGEVLFESLARSNSSPELKLDALAAAKLDEHPRLRDVVPDADRELDAICKKALAVEPADRFQTAAEMHFALTTYLKNKRCTKARSMLTDGMTSLFGSAITKRGEVMRKLSFGSYDIAELLYTLRGEAVTENDILQGGKGSFDEESFLATIKPGEMDRAPPPPGPSRPSLAEAKLHLRGPRRERGQKLEPEIAPSPPPEPDVLDMPTETAPVDPDPTSWSALIDIGDPDW